MAAHPRSKEIQVQKPAQSLQAFQQKLATDVEPGAGLLKPVAIGTGVVLVLAMGFFGIRAYRASALEKHEAAVAELVRAVQGESQGEEGPAAPNAAEVEKRMGEKLPALEALAKRAPGSAKISTEGLVATWKLQLEGKGTPVAQGSDPWSTLRVAQRHMALGEAEQAAGLLGKLRGSAKADQPWAPLFWNTLFDLHRLKGDRAQAWKDYADYKSQFKDRADASLDKVMAGI